MSVALSVVSVLLLVLLGQPSLVQAQTATGKSGFRTGSITYQRSNGNTVTLPLAVWYPTRTSAGWYKYPYVWGRVAQDAPTVPGPWPLIVHSHGVDECAVASGYLNEALANAGYIVAAVDHDDAADCLTDGGTRRRSAWNVFQPNETNFPFRTSDIRALLDAMLSSPTWAPLIDQTRIGASGHSLGGWTISALADSRIRARLLLAPSYELSADFYASVPAPSAYIFGEFASGYFSAKYRTLAYDSSPAPRFLGYVDEAGHYSATDKQCELSLSTVLCRAAAIPAAIVSKSQAFLNYYLRSDAAAYAALINPDPRYLIWLSQP
jgi:dienelactone hydrolase